MIVGTITFRASINSIKSRFLILLFLSLTLLLSCAEPVCIGDVEVEGREISLCEVFENFEHFADGTVEVAGIFEGDFVKSRRDNCSLALFPVGFAVPESLIGGRGEFVGTVFYQEETDEPGLAVIGMRVRPPKGR